MSTSASTTTSTSTGTTTGPRPVGVIHLIFGLIFCGIAALWLIGNANDADFPDLAKGVPAVLIGAGLVGLGASAVNHRRAKARLLARDAVAAETPAETYAVTPAEESDLTSEIGAPGSTPTPASASAEETLVIQNEKDEQ